MRTTVNVDDELLAQAKLIAARTHRTIGSVLEDGLRMVLAESGDRAEPVALPDFAYRGGLNAGVDLYDRDAMSELLHEGSDGHALS